MDQCRRDRSTESASRSIGVRCGNRRLRLPDASSIASSKKILAHQTSHATTCDEQCVGSTVQEGLSRALHIDLASDLAFRKKSRLMKIGCQQYD